MPSLERGRAFGPRVVVGWSIWQAFRSPHGEWEDQLIDVRAAARVAHILCVCELRSVVICTSELELSLPCRVLFSHPGNSSM
jgi:hypothetical protein